MRAYALLLREESVSFQAVKTWKTSTDPDYEAKKNRVLELYAIADCRAEPGPEDPSVIMCMDEFGPLNLQPHPGKQWAPVAAGKGSPSAPRRRTRRATYKRPHGVRHLMAGYDLSTDRLYGHVTKHKGRVEFLAFCRYLRSLHPPEVRIAIVLTTSARTAAPRPTAGSGLGLGKQRRARLRPVLRLLAQPDRGPVHRAALLRPRRHRPPQPHRASQHDPALHRLAEPARGHPPTAT